MVRSVHYQLVTRGLIPNTTKVYERLSRLLTDARMAGLVDWDAIEDRHRSWQRRSRWGSPTEIIECVPREYHMDMWKNQAVRPFIVVEKDALSGVLENICYQYDTPLMAAKGYTSCTILRKFSTDDILPALEDGQAVVIFHLGDHDPSGLDMTRDIEDRIRIFTRNGNGKYDIRLARLGLNIDQVKALRLPPNFAKEKDRRFAAYKKQFGDKCWELDALPPDYMVDVVETVIKELIDEDAWSAKKKEIEAGKVRLAKVVANFRRKGGTG